MDQERAIKFLIEDFSQRDLRQQPVDAELREALWQFLSVRPRGDRGIVIGAVKTAVTKLTRRQAASLQRAVRPFVLEALEERLVARRPAAVQISGVQLSPLQFHGKMVFFLSGRLSSIFRFQVARLLLRAGDFVVRFGRCEAPRARSWESDGPDFERCGRLFYRTRRTRRFCSGKCKARRWAREHQ